MTHCIPIVQITWKLHPQLFSYFESREMLYGKQVNALVNVDGSYAKSSGNSTGMLPTSAAEARQNMTRRVVTTSLLMTTSNSIINVIIASRQHYK